MNPLSLTGGGGFSGSSGVTDQSSTAATSGTGAKNIGIAANPNAAGRALENILSNPAFLLAVVALVYLLFIKKGR